ncbi:hypothetical protein ABH524_008505 [Staphylococcus pasteuri]
MEDEHMELLGKIINFTMETVSNWLGSSSLFDDVKKLFKKKNDN